MDIFLLGAMGFVVVALAVYIAASLRLEHLRRKKYWRNVNFLL
jgi:hypothetical protein